MQEGSPYLEEDRELFTTVGLDVIARINDRFIHYAQD